MKTMVIRWLATPRLSENDVGIAWWKLMSPGKQSICDWVPMTPLVSKGIDLHTGFLQVPWCKSLCNHTFPASVAGEALTPSQTVFLFVRLASSCWLAWWWKINWKQRKSLSVLPSTGMFAIKFPHLHNDRDSRPWNGIRTLKARCIVLHGAIHMFDH